MEPLGVAHNIIERIDVINRNVLVIGCGPVGLLAVATAKALGAKQITAVDIFDEKLKLAKNMGAHSVLNSAKVDLTKEVMKMTNGVGFERICEASGMSHNKNTSHAE